MSVTQEHKGRRTKHEKRHKNQTTDTYSQRSARDMHSELGQSFNFQHGNIQIQRIYTDVGETQNGMHTANMADNTNITHIQGIEHAIGCSRLGIASEREDRNRKISIDKRES